MKQILFILFVALFISSCEKQNSPSSFYEFLRSRNVNKVLISDNKLWVISSNPQGLSEIPMLPECQVSVLNLKNNDFLVNSKMPSIMSFALDKNGRIYLATYDGRVISLNEDLTYEDYFKIPNLGSIQSILFDQNNNLWVASGSKGLISYDGTTTKVYDSTNSILKTNYASPLVMDSKSNIWFLPRNDLFMIDNTGKIIKDPYPFPLLNEFVPYWLSVDKNNTLFISKWDRYTERIYKRIENSGWIEVAPPKSYNHRPVKFIKSDSNGTIWIVYSNYPKDISAYYESSKWNEIQLPSDIINIFDIETYHNDIILGTPQGIYRTTFK
jgi:ligand-binding sensor domain-containing protein